MESPPLPDETLKAAERLITTALRELEELEAPKLCIASQPAGGLAREAAMDHLRTALRKVGEARNFHRRHTAALHHVLRRERSEPMRVRVPRPARRPRPAPSGRT